jgi:hypothetical protein
VKYVAVQRISSLAINLLFLLFQMFLIAVPKYGATCGIVESLGDRIPYETHYLKIKRGVCSWFSSYLNELDSPKKWNPRNVRTLYLETLPLT